VFNKIRGFASKTPNDQLSHSGAMGFGKKPYVILIAVIVIGVIAGAPFDSTRSGINTTKSQLCCG
jgi:hypothetical protein